MKPGPKALVRYLQIIFVTASVSVFVLISNACYSKPPQASAGAKKYDLRGKVVSVDRSSKKVTINHQAIEGYMEAMTMPFTLVDDWAFEHLEPGADIQATLVVDTGRTWLENPVVTSVGPAGDTTAVAEPRRGDEVPNLELVNDQGRKIHLHDFHGKNLVVTFIYTRCPLPDYCPLMTSNFVELNRLLEKEPALASRTRLLSITVDPEYDTPRVLHAYRTRHAPDSTARWEFATGTPEQIKAVSQFFGLSYWQEKDQIIHSLRTSVITPDGKVQKVIHGNEWKPKDILPELAR